MLKQRSYQSGHLLQRTQKADDQLPEMIGSLDGGLAAFVMFQVIPHQFVRVRKSKPKRSQIVLLSALLALLVGILAAFVREAIAKTGSDPQRAERLRSVGTYLASAR